MEEPCGADGLGGGATAPQEPGVLVEVVGAEQLDPRETVRALQEELSAALAEVETLRAVATVSEGTKQEAVAAVRRQCQEEVASLQAILKDTISSYEARLEALQQEQHGGGSWGSWELSRLQQQQTQGNPLDSLERQMEKAQEDSERLRSIVLPMEEEIAQLKSKLSRAEGLIQGLRGPEGLLCVSSESLLSDREAPSRMPPAHPGGEGDEGSGPEGEEEPGGGLAFTRGCDNVSIISIASSSAGSPQPRRRPSPEHEDTASLLSTGTLVPESIYLLPPGFQLVPDGEWAQLQQEARRHQESLQQLREQLEAAMQEKLGLQEALRQSSEDCAKQVLVLLDQIQKSEQLLQNLQATVSQTQHRTQEQIELQALVRQLQEEAGTLRRASEHHSERLRIEIVTLRERLDEEEATRARLQGVLEAQLGAQREESQLMEASLCSVRSEMERLQQQLGQAEHWEQRGPWGHTGFPFLPPKAEQRAQGLEQDVQRLRGDLTQRDQQGQAWEQEKARLEAVLSEQRGKLQRLQAELDTSEQVQRDFVRLSQTLQVQLERIRQAPSLEQVRSIVDGTRLKDVAELKEP
ncbi:rab GTPase-binding effector protein 2 isoform X5 [Gopherus evgoodei]|uniref:rab GTPase-binding effector protein 2 isoform X5 n=1 Tax=Gopherus evgoodei TaxID=1825980 RepID=UPI0011CED8D4|nr:rab GTPase-binding effector protein 2 isoform X5 [Gopherus evgoodei]